MTEPVRHHYIPQFYLKRWLNLEGKLYVYKKGVREPLIIPELSLNGFCQENNLYSIPNIQLSNPEIIEKDFFGCIDSSSAIIINKLENREVITEEEKEIWLIFCRSLYWRSPMGLEDVLCRAKNISYFKELIDNVLNSKELSKFLMCILEFEKEGHLFMKSPIEVFKSEDTLFASDNLSFSNLKNRPLFPGLFTSLALSPHTMFINQVYVDYKFTTQFRREYNKNLVLTANRFIFTTDRNDEDFILKHFK